MELESWLLQSEKSTVNRQIQILYKIYIKNTVQISVQIDDRVVASKQRQCLLSGGHFRFVR